MPAETPFQQRLEAIERLLGNIESAADPSLRADVRELVQLVMDLHGAGIERMLELIRAAGDSGSHIVQQMGRDDLAASLLILYGLHPLSLDARVNQALEKVRPRLRAHDGAAELLGVEDGVVRLRLEANGHGCGSTAEALREMVEGAIYQNAPDVSELVIDLTGKATNSQQGFVPLEMLQSIAPAGSGR